MPDMPQGFNLIDASWPPVRRRSGAIERITPWRLNDRIRAGGISRCRIGHAPEGRISQAAAHGWEIGLTAGNVRRLVDGEGTVARGRLVKRSAVRTRGA